MSPALCLRAILLSAILLATGEAADALQLTILEPIGGQPTVTTPQGRVVEWYEQSNALLISVADYQNPRGRGWRPLPSTTKEVDDLAQRLREHGFRVWRVKNPTFSEFDLMLRRFLAEAGTKAKSRIVFYFAGHGYTDKATNISYLVPSDALSPSLERQNFLERAMPIEQLEQWARRLESRHAMLFFDSCFSGSIFLVRSDALRAEDRGQSTSDRWRFFETTASHAVRHIVAAGGADEELPSESRFVQLLTQALGGALNTADGYLTGKEIGTWLEQQVPNFVPTQHPYSGVVRDPRLARGDMIFQLPNWRYTRPESSVVEQRILDAPPGLLQPSPPLAVKVADYGRGYMAFSDDGQFFVFAGDNTVRAFTTTDGRLLHSFSEDMYPGVITPPAISPSGDLVAVGDQHGVVHIYSMRSKSKVKELTFGWLQKSDVVALQFLSEDLLFGASSDRTSIWSVASGRTIDTPLPEAVSTFLRLLDQQNKFIRSAVVSRDRNRVLIGVDTRVGEFDLATGRLISVHNPPGKYPVLSGLAFGETSDDHIYCNRSDELWVQGRFASLDWVQSQRGVQSSRRIYTSRGSRCGFAVSSRSKVWAAFSLPATVELFSQLRVPATRPNVSINLAGPAKVFEGLALSSDGRQLAVSGRVAVSYGAREGVYVYLYRLGQ